jgi:integrase
MATNVRKRLDRGPNAYELRVFLGRDADGKIRHKSVLFRGTQRAAEREQRRLEAERLLAPAPVPHRSARAWGPTTTINDAIAGWRANGWQDLSPTTTRGFESFIFNHIEPSIGNRTIVSLSPYDIEVFLRQLKNKGLSQASVRQTRAILRRACGLVRKWSGNILPNPVADAEMPKWTLDEQRQPRRSPTVTEVRRILYTAEQEGDVRVFSYLRFDAATGVRRGEACAIRWKDLDFTTNTVSIHDSIVTKHGGSVVKEPKSWAGVRRTTFDGRTAEVLHALLKETERVGAMAGFRVEPEHFVFAMKLPGTKPPYPDTFSHAFRRIRSLAGVASDVSIHSLRHFQSTELDAVLSTRQKQARLGWSTIQMAHHYTDAVPEEDQRAAEHIGRLLDGEAASSEPQRGQGPIPPPEGAGVSTRIAPKTRSTARRGTESRPLMRTTGRGKSPRRIER